MEIGKSRAPKAGFSPPREGKIEKPKKLSPHKSPWTQEEKLVSYGILGQPGGVGVYAPMDARGNNFFSPGCGLQKRGEVPRSPGRPHPD